MLTCLHHGKAIADFQGLPVSRFEQIGTLHGSC